MTLPAIKPLATMEEAWAEYGRLRAESERYWAAEGDRLRAEHDRLWPEYDRLGAEYDRLQAEGDRLRAEHDRLRAEGNLVVIATVQALYGKNALIDWRSRTVKSGKEE